MNGYAKSIDETKYMWFLIEYEKSLKACSKVQNKISNIMQKGSESKPLCKE